MDIADLITNAVYLTGAGPLVIVDRDGSLALAAGGILSQKTQRQIKVLFGGLEAYWNSAEMGEPIRAVPLAPGATKVQPSVPPTPAAQPFIPALPVQPAPQKPKTPKKKSAGC